MISFNVHLPWSRQLRTWSDTECQSVFELLVTDAKSYFVHQKEMNAKKAVYITTQHYWNISSRIRKSYEDDGLTLNDFQKYVYNMVVMRKGTGAFHRFQWKFAWYRINTEDEIQQRIQADADLWDDWHDTDNSADRTKIHGSNK